MLRRALMLSLCLAGAGAFAEDAGVLVEQKMLREWSRYADTLDGVVGVAAIDLKTGRTVSLNGDVVFAQASMIKIPILVELFRAASVGSIKLDESVTLTKADRVGGSGRLTQRLAKEEKVTLTVRELAAQMIEFSDNLATNKIIAMVKMSAVNENLDRLGLKRTRLQRIMMDTAAAASDRENISTPNEMVRLVQMIWQKKLPGSEEMLAMLQTVDAGFRGTIPEEVATASKPGSVGGVRGESGVVLLPERPFALSVMGAFLGTMRNPVPSMVRIAYENFEKLDRSNRYGNRVR